MARTSSKWRTGVLDLKHESGEGVGAIYRQGVKGPGGRRVAADFEVTTYEPNSLFGFRTIAGPVRPRGELRLEPAGDATRLTFALEAEVTGVKKLLMGRMVARTMESEVHNIENVKRILEGQSAS
jgi:uncharacterized membrane protein